jgi:tight adherence protein B
VIMMHAALSAALLANGFIGSVASRLVIAILTGCATAGLVVSMTVIFGKRQARLERRLAGYDVSDMANRPNETAGTASELNMMQSAVDMTERLAGQAGVLERAELMLQQADLPLRPAEVLFYVPVFAIMAFVIAVLLSDIFTALIVGAIVLLGPVGYVVYRRKERVREFERQLPDTLQLLSGAMRAGFSFMQGLETVADESHGAMRRELQRVFTESRLGRSVEDALGETAVRMDSRDLEWAVLAIRIQREVGGNLASLLDTVADTMTQRERLRREVQTLTAEGRLSAILVSAFPPVFGLFLFMTRREYMKTLWSESAGIVAMCIAAGAWVIGWFWLRKLVKIEV